MPKGIANGRDLRNGNKPVPLLDRIMAHHYVDGNGCWIWTATQDKLGYGHLTIGAWLTGKIHTRKAYAVAYELLVGPVPDGLELDHLCRVPACINPAHLEPVTHRVNTQRGDQGQWQRDKTHCPQGHPYDEKNTYMVPGDRWHRRCRACRAAAERRRTAQRNKGGPFAQDRIQGTVEGRYRSDRDWRDRRDREDPSDASFPQSVMSGGTAFVPRARVVPPHHDERGTVTLTVLATLAALIVVVGVVVGGYQLHWWLRGQEVNRSAAINRKSFEVQQTYREKALDDIALVSGIDAQIVDPAYKDIVGQLRAQRIATVRQTCDAISRLTTSGAGVDPDVQSFHDTECAQ